MPKAQRRAKKSAKNIMKASAKMRKSIAKLMKTYGLVAYEGNGEQKTYEVKISYELEMYPELHARNGFFDYCNMFWDGRTRASVAHDGSITLW